jgi:nitrogen fixation NifU-like protein
VSLEALYQELILEHARHPRNFGKINKPSTQVEHENPVCGDRILLQVEITGDQIKDIKFFGQGCAISQSSASMMTAKVKGLDLSTAEHTIEIFKAMMVENDDKYLDELGELQALKGVRRFPVRIKCAVLAWKALKNCIDEYKNKS